MDVSAAVDRIIPGGKGWKMRRGNVSCVVPSNRHMP